jgi:LPS export ABC transporter permease LptG/LPS export ABC transporter permease LptF
MSIIDRYILRQVLPPMLLALLVFTFVLLIPGLIEHAEAFIAKGVSPMVVGTAMLTLVPSALALTIPMSVLVGLLVALARLSSDREFVAMQACGISLVRLLRPVGLVSIMAWAATSYVYLVAVPESNQRFREIAFNVLASKAEGEVRSRAFFDEFPNLVLYVQEIPANGLGWNGVFLSDRRPNTPSAVYVARHGRVAIDRQKQTVEMLLENGARHTTDPKGAYEVFQFDRLVIGLDPETYFPRQGPQKGVNELTIAELQQRIRELERQGQSPHNERMKIQQKFSIPVACLVFGLIGIALGATNRRDGALGSFVQGLVVIFLYYVPMYLGPALTKGGLIPPWLAAWLPNIILGVVGLLLFRWRGRSADRPLRIPLPSWRRSAAGTPDSAWEPRYGSVASGNTGPVRLLDRYVASAYIRVFGLATLALAGIFYISTFLDLSDKVFKGDATWGMLGTYFVYITPQYAYYILPLAVLLAALVTIGVLTKNNELVVMKACGISLYRVAVPMLVCAAVTGTLLFALGESILGPANRRAERLRGIIRTGVAPTAISTRQWIAGERGEIYNYTYADPATQALLQVSIFSLNEDRSRLVARSFADRALPRGPDTDHWTLEHGWRREFRADGAAAQFAAFESSAGRMAQPSVFATDEPDARFMGYRQLQGYADRLRASGLDVLGLEVALARKLSFPFVTIIMTLIAVPFAVLTGHRGAMAGIGVGIGLAMTYWTTISVCAAMGAGGMMPPTIAAWAPNAIFGAGAAYLLLSVRT